LPLRRLPEKGEARYVGLPIGTSGASVDIGSMTIDRHEITCLLADDHPPIIDCLERYLRGAGFDVVGIAADGEAARARIEATKPRVCVADLRMPKLDGLELARHVATAAPETVVLLYSGHADRGLVSDALDAGAHGFALKDAPLEDLARAIDTVAGGGLYVDPVLAAELAARRSESGKQQLSERERQVLRMLAEGGSYTEIGAELYLSPDTVRAHAQRAMTKLGARTRTQAVAVAMRGAMIA
jgi:DNA-binding NarL/FixJ family response regulator